MENECKHHPEYEPAAGEPSSARKTWYCTCWQARAKWLEQQWDDSEIELGKRIDELERQLEEEL